VQQRNDYPANFSEISDLLLKMADLKIAQAEPIGPSQLGRMQLAQPGSGPDSATLIEFKDAQGKDLQSLLLGKKHTRKADRPSPYGDSEMPDGRYIMLKSNPDEMLTISDPLTSVDAQPSGWLDRNFFKIEKPKTISFVSTNAADSWALSRQSDTGPWVLADVKKGEALDTNKVTSLAGAFSYPSFVDVVTDTAPARTGMDKPLVVTITTFDYFTYTLKIGAKTAANDYDLTVDVAADFPKEWSTPNETATDKKKIDQVFADKFKPLQDKLQQEKALQGWTYLVNNWLIDPIIRKRAQLMVEKIAEKKEAASPEPAPTDASPLPSADSNSQ
jgi:hypothetical protein